MDCRTRALSGGEESRTPKAFTLDRIRNGCHHPLACSSKSTQSGIRTHNYQFLKLVPTADWATWAKLREQGSDLRPLVEQTSALPTELPRNIKYRFATPHRGVSDIPSIPPSIRGTRMGRAIPIMPIIGVYPKYYRRIP